MRRGSVSFATIRENRARAGKPAERIPDCTTCGDTGTAHLLHGGVHFAPEPCPDCPKGGGGNA